MGFIKTDAIAPNGSTGLLLYTDIQATVVGLKLESGGGVGFGSAGVPSGIKVDVLGNIAVASLSIPTSSTIAGINAISTMRIGQTNSSIKLNIGSNPTSSWIQSYNTSNNAGASLLLQSGGGNVGIGTASPTVALDVSGAVKATSFAGNGTIPIGGIIMWSGAIANIPTGWALCNGVAVGGITPPNLRDKFIVGAGSVYAVDALGGSANSMLPVHRHIFVMDDNIGGFTPATLSSTHDVNKLNSLSTGGSEGGGGGLTRYSTSKPVRGTATDGTPTSEGDGTNGNLPPYYALAFIMRVA